MAPAEWGLWQQVLAHLKGESAGLAIPPWLAEAKPAELSTSQWAVTLPEAARSAEVSAAQRLALERALERTVGRRVALEFRADQAAKAATAAAGWPARFLQRDHPPLNPLYEFENFVTGPCNRMAHAAALAVSDLPGRAYNPLFIHASVGLGKSHLMQAICHKILATRPDVAILYVSCEDFVNQFITAIERGQIEQFRYKFRYLDVLVIDDIHFLANKTATQGEFLHTFNAIDASGKAVVLSCDCHPRNIATLSEPLVDRLIAAMIVRIEPPDFATRREILRRRAAAMLCVLPDDVLDYVARRITRNVRELQGALYKLAAYATLTKEPVRLDVARQVVEDYVGTTQPPEAADIERAVGVHLGVTREALRSKSRDRLVTHARGIAMFMIRKHTRMSFPEIGRWLGNK